MNATVAERLAAAMERHGVTEIFGQSLPSAFLLACEARGIPQTVYRTENAGGAMADGYARAGHRPAVVAAQNGPAATLLVPPLSEAHASSVPVVAVVQDVPTGHRDRNAFQELDHAALFASSAKWVRRLDDPERVDHYVDLAFTAALSGRPGPAVLLVPKDVLRLPSGSDERRRAGADRSPLDRPRPEACAVTEAASVLAGARRPLVVAGGGVHGSDATAALAALRDVARLPVATTVMGKGAVDETHPLSVGVLGHFMGRGGVTHGLREWIAGVDAVLLVGTRTAENGTDSWRTLPEDARYAHLDIDGVEIGRNYPALRLVGDVRAGLEDLTAVLRGCDLGWRRAGESEVVAALGAAHEEHRRVTGAVRGSAARPIRPERVMAEIDRQLTPDTIVVSDASYSSVWTANYLHARRDGQRFLAPRGLAGLGWGLPLALGAQRAVPDSPVVCVTGDGGFAHCWAELETAVRHGLSPVVVVLNNALLGYQRHAEVHTLGAATSAVGIGALDHVAIARGCGAEGIRVDDPELLAESLAKALACAGPTVLDVETDPDAYPPLTGWEDDDRLTGGI